MAQVARWERRDIEIAMPDSVVLRGWHYAQAAAGAPVIVMSHGFGVVKEMHLDLIAEVFADRGFNCVVYDHRCLGASDGLPRHHVDPWQQLTDCREVVTFARNLPDVDGGRLGIWGTSYSGGHALVMGATDRRIRAVVSQGATISGWRTSLRRFPGDSWGEMAKRFADDRDAVFRGAAPTLVKQMALSENDIKRSDIAIDTATPGNSSVEWIRATSPERLATWGNLLTLRSLELYRSYEPGAFIAQISPTPLLVITMDNDATTPTDEILDAYNRAREPKRLKIIRGGHCDLYACKRGEAVRAALEFYREVL
jgi:pimeloyl-ACP methyl ester carboxylesterase